MNGYADRRSGNDILNQYLDIYRDSLSRAENIRRQELKRNDHETNNGICRKQTQGLQNVSPRDSQQTYESFPR